MSLKQKFLYKRDETGRFIVISKRTKREYFVEPIGGHSDWGSIDPATGKMTAKKGFKKYKGSIEADESLITKENGFEKIHSLNPGESPLEYIERLDSQY